MAARIARMVLGRAGGAGEGRMLRAERGLFHGKKTRTGNNRSHSLRATPTACGSPNVQWVRLWSDALETRLRLKVTPKALKVIDKRGGLDKLPDSTPAVAARRREKARAARLVSDVMTAREMAGEPTTWLERLRIQRAQDAAAGKAATPAAAASAGADEEDEGILDVELPEAEAEAEAAAAAVIAEEAEALGDAEDARR
ncbi:hypothetical protein FNF28_07648 [Cafeteria roenbergensis]|uniref:Ribosomal protein L28 n=1 Tax=Cafeteria roenbergensis TaxID=33653 RepID=A0A5A8C1L8_CAFRO|nr:hypothetical protein FNF28_07648 [Cafeteria roenbergensis]